MFKQKKKKKWKLFSIFVAFSILDKFFVIGNLESKNLGKKKKKKTKHAINIQVSNNLALVLEI